MTKHPDWFMRWQQQFYHSARWIALRNAVREEARMRCAQCGQLVKGKGIVDHIIEVSPGNCTDESITLSRSNLRYLCLECHNAKTFGVHQSVYEIDEREEVNLY